MKAVLDTNVLVSGIFFGGQPRAVLDAWAAGRFELVLSPSIFDEYVRTCDRLGASHEGLKYEAILATIIGHGPLVADTMASGPITADPDDDKFMSCALTKGAIVVSGDRHLLDMSGWEGVRVMGPHDFLAYLESPDVSCFTHDLTGKNILEVPMVRLATTKLSSKGQVVIPEAIRDRLGLEAGVQFVVVAEGDVVVLKVLKAPEMSDFKALLDEAQRSAAAVGLTPEDVEEALREVRVRK